MLSIFLSLQLCTHQAILFSTTIPPRLWIIEIKGCRKAFCFIRLWDNFKVMHHWQFLCNRVHVNFVRKGVEDLAVVEEEETRYGLL